MSELLGGDLMEHNILHEGIGVTDTLEILQRYHSELKQPEQYTHFYLIKTIHLNFLFVKMWIAMMKVVNKNLSKSMFKCFKKGFP